MTSSGPTLSDPALSCAGTPRAGYRAPVGSHQSRAKQSREGQFPPCFAGHVAGDADGRHLAFWAGSAHCWLMSHLSPTGIPCPSPQDWSQLVHAPICTDAEGCLSLSAGLTWPMFSKVPLVGIPSLSCIHHSGPLGLTCRCAEHTLKQLPLLLRKILDSIDPSKDP